MAPSMNPVEVNLQPYLNERLPLDHNVLEGILNTNVAAIILVNTNGQITFVNDAAEKILGIPKSLITQRFYNASDWKITDIEGNPFPEAELPFVRVMTTGEAVSEIQHAIALDNGERRYLSINGSPLKDVFGTINQIVFSIINITDQVQSKKTQQEALEFYRQAFESSPAIKLLIDPVTAKIVDANPAAARFYGYPIDVLKQMKITDINQLPPQDVQASIAQTCSQKTYCWVFPHRLASGEIRQVEVHCSQLNLQDRELLYSVIHDISDRQQAENALQSQLKQEQLLEDVAQAIRRSLDLKVVLQTTVNQVQQLLGADRVVIYRPTTPNSIGSVVVESCSSDYPSLLGWEIGSSGIEQRRFIQPYQQGQSQALIDISKSDLDPAYMQLLEIFQVKSQLTIPIIQTTSQLLSNSSFLSNNVAVDSSEKHLPTRLMGTPATQIWGLLIVHHCASVHVWQDWEVNMLQRLEMQLAVAIQQAELYQHVQQLNADLESQVRQRTMQLQKSLNAEAVLRLITDKIHGTLSEAAILETAVQKLALALNLISCHASLYDLKTQTATVCYEYTDSGISLKGTVTSIEQYPEIYQFLLQGEPLQFCSSLFDAQSESFPVLCYPIVDDEQGALGDLKLLAPKERIFEPRDLQLVQQVAKQCAIALRQSRLYQTAQAQIQELEKLNRLKDDFLSTTSHELRTPLSNIKTSTELMRLYLAQSGQPIHPKIERCLTILREECDREITLINNLLLLQQLNAKTHPFIPSTLNLRDWIPQIVETFEEKFQHHQQICQVDIDANLPPMVTDLFMFNQIMSELLTNAHKFTPAGETIAIAARLKPECSNSQGARVEISVTNTGVEIAVGELLHVFDQFYRIPSNDPWKHGGTGVGLMLVKKLVQYMDGAIEVTSHAGQTCFTVELPLHARL
ncbi:PAS domain S-box protein [Oscillatoria sp. FACHB-1407]|uniref:PAS domain S-box protein n=1 Tax=Oscillatoria sp. FACHB-1407 TaxID=2692847 RepID=UPI0016821708|nr:PAS domain S-box protein [Oscillatoria sp. FACHB-1407]MBD2465677.1 PAS domain S-box protein [Oscillatoria sp. FACHB-1407]